MESSIVKHPMSDKMGLEIFNYMMETSGRILELSEISRNSDIGVADELNLIANNMAHHANTILREYCGNDIVGMLESGITDSKYVKDTIEMLTGFQELQSTMNSLAAFEEFKKQFLKSVKGEDRDNE